MDATNLLQGGAAVALVMGLVQVVKGTNIIEDRFLPLLALVLGILVVALNGLTTGTLDIPVTVLGGLAVGLSACGLYSGTKAVVQPKQDAPQVVEASALVRPIAPRVESYTDSDRIE